MRDDRLFLEDILEAIRNIEEYAPLGRPKFDQDKLIQTWMVHHIQVIGEAARRVSQGLHAKHPEVPWTEIGAMRNILVHDYFRIDPDEVWSVVTNDLPVLKPQIESILKEIKSR